MATYNNQSTVEGTEQGDSITGTSGDDLLFGHEGDDQFHATEGSDVIDGGNGTDTLHYSDSFNDYSISTSSSGALIVAKDQSQDALVNIENLVFEDAQVQISWSGSAQSFQVNTTTAGVQDSPSLCALDDGGWLSIWVSESEDETLYELRAQRYDAAGQAAADEMLISSSTARISSPAVSSLNSGGWVATWDVNDPTDGSTDVMGQIFSANGTSVADAFTVNSTTASNQSNPAVTGLADGSFVVCWESDGQDGSRSGIFAQRYQSDGTPIGSEFQINTYTSSYQSSPCLTPLADGGWLAVWESFGQDGSGFGIYGKFYAADGTTRIEEFQINTTTDLDQAYPDVINLTDGDLIAAWQSYDSENGAWVAYAQRFDQNGTMQGGEIQLSSPNSGSQTDIHLAALTDGQWAAVWSSDDQVNRIHIQRYSADDTPVGDLITTDETKGEGEPVITALDNGGFVVTWQQRDKDGSGISALRYHSDGHFSGQELSTQITAMPGADRLTGTAGADTFLHTEGPQTIFGQGGTDTAVFDDIFANYQFNTLDTGTLQVAHNGDILSLLDIETLVFADAELTLEQGSSVPHAEFQVNTYTDNYQSYPSVTALTDGGWLVTWKSMSQDGSYSGIYAQRYAADGNTVDDEFQVNTYTSSKYSPSVTALTDGGWLVTWMSRSQDGSGGGIYAQRYGIDGGTVDDEFQVNTYTTGSQGSPSVTNLSDGGWLVTWVSDSQDGSGFGIYAQRYSADGSTVDDEFQVNTYTSNDQLTPSVTALTDGGWLVAWQSDNQDGSDCGIYAQRYAADGSTVDDEFQVNTYTTNDQRNPSVTALTDGGWLVTWQCDRSGIYAQRYAADGSTVNDEFQVNTDTSTSNYIPSVTDLSDGGWLVTWVSDGQDGSSWGIYAQRYAPDGSTIGNEFQVNTYTDSYQREPSVTALTDGGWLVAWQSDSQDGSDYGIYAQRYAADGQALSLLYNFILTGDGTDQILSGGDGDDTIDGQGGADQMSGGNGDDIYIVADVDDVVLEGEDAGTDTIQSSVSFDLPDHVENITLTGSEATDAQDNALANRIVGNSAHNVFTLSGGDDTVTGGAGQDSVVYENNFDGFSYGIDDHFVIEIDTPSGEIDELSGIETMIWNDAVLEVKDGSKVDLRVSDLRVNTYTADSQSCPSVTALSDGGWLVTWQSSGQDGSSSGIYAQRYAADGSPVDDEFQVNTYTSSSQSSPSVTALSDGGWLVTWTSSGQDGSGSGVYAQRYAADGSTVDDEFQVNTYTDSDQYSPSVTALSDGGWLVTWQSNGQDGSGYGIYAQRYAADGSPVDDEFQVNTYTDSSQWEPSVTALTDGGWIIVWHSSIQDDLIDCIFAQRYTADGSLMGDEFKVNTYTQDHQGSPGIAALSDGGWLVTWQSYGQDGSGYGVYAQRYVADGSPVDGEFQVNTYTSSYQSSPSVTALSDGGWLVTWHSSGQDGSYHGIYAQRYAADGSPVDDEFQVNTYTDNSQYLPSVTALSDGGWLVTWTSSGQDGSGYGIYAQRYEVDGEPLYLEKTFTLTGDQSSQTLQGGDAVDQIYGEGGDDTLDGQGGEDTLLGGEGDDTYIIHDNDTILENENEGDDRIVASINYTMPQNVEELILTDTDDLHGTGNEQANTLRVSSNQGHVLTGGDGQDLYQFEVLDGVNTITDYQIGERIQFLNLDGYLPMSAGDGSLTSLGAVEYAVNDGDMTLYVGIDRDPGADAEIILLGFDNPDQLQVTGVNSLPQGEVVITGDHEQGGALTAVTDSISDSDGLNTFSYQWLRNDVAIEGATQRNYTLTQDDVGTMIHVTVSYEDAHGVEEWLRSDSTGMIANIDDEASGSLIVTGDAEEGGSLSASLSEVSDPDGAVTQTAWQWQISENGASGWNDLEGATSATYAIADDQSEVGQYLRVIATTTDELGGTTSFTSDATAAIANVNDAPEGAVTVSGTAQQGETLQADTSALSDADGLGELNYQWLRDGVDIEGATLASHTLTQEDIGTQISVQVSYTDGYGSEESITSEATVAVGNVDDAASGSLLVTGDAEEGGTLSAALNDLSDPDGSITQTAWQWQTSENGTSGWSDLEGATASTYAISDDQSEVGQYLRVVATTTDELGGTSSFTSDATAAIANINDAPEGAVTVSGTAQQGETLQADTSTLTDADGLGEFNYQWLRHGVGIEGATTASHTLTQEDIGTQISVEVSYTDGFGTEESITSDATAAVGNVDDEASGSLLVTGDAEEGGTLSAALNDLSDPDGSVTQTAWQWQTSENGTSGWSDLEGATASTYDIAEDQSEVGQYLRVIATTTDELGGTTSFTSDATAAIANVNDAPEVSQALVDQSATQDSAFTFEIPANTFSDVDNDSLSLSATLADGSALPSWLSFDANTATFTGTPTNADVGSVNIKVSAEDAAASVSDTFTLSVENIDDDATGNLSVSGIAEEGGSLTAALNDLNDPDGDTTTAYQWQIDGGTGWEDLSGATQATVSIPADQSYVGRAVRVIATTTDELGGITTFISNASAAIANVNDAPMLQSPDPITYTDTPQQDTFPNAGGTLVGSDADDDILNYSIADGIDQGDGFVSLGGTYGSLMLNTATGAYTFSPNDSAIETLAIDDTETFTLTATDGISTTQVKLDIDIIAVNDLPQAYIDSATTDQDTTVTIDVLDNDTDAENDTLSITSITDPTYGSVSITEDNQILYTPQADYSGTDSFDYAISDGSGGMDTATVNVTIEEVEDDETSSFWYSEEFYLLNNPDVAAAVSSGAFANGWQHYSNFGYLEGRSFVKPDDYGDFSEYFYALNNPDVNAAVEAGAFINGWEHYSGFGQAEGRSYAAPEGCGDFSEEFYLFNNPDVAEAVEAGYLSNGWYHYSNFGEAEGRSYAAPEGYDDFSEEFYLFNNPDVAAAVEAGYLRSGWYHYSNFGEAEGRSCAEPEGYGDFNEVLYLLNNPDVAAVVEAGYLPSGWYHYSNFGEIEGRSYELPEDLLENLYSILEDQGFDDVMSYLPEDYMDMYGDLYQDELDELGLLGVADDVMDDLLGA